MSKDETTFEDELSADATPDDVQDSELPDDEVEPDKAPAGEDSEGSSDDKGDSEADVDSDTEALDDLEAEELEMLTEDEASETIVVDEATQLRDIRRAQISIERGEVGGATDDEFVCSVCFLVKKSSQLSSRRKKVCLDCAD